MKKQYQKYSLKPKDTISTIAKELRISESELIQFHNENCFRSEYKIKDYTLPLIITEILISPDIEIKETNKQLDEIKLETNQNFQMILKPDVLTYGVMITIFSEGQSDTIKYNVSVQWAKIDSFHYKVRIDRLTNTYINDEEPDLMAEELSVKVSSCLYPLELIVNLQSRITGIRNFKTIRDRWESTKQELHLYYAGEYLEKFIRLNEKILQNEESLLKSLDNDYFLNALFNKLYVNYTKKLQISHLISFPMIFNVKKAVYRVDQSIDEYVNKEGRVLVEMKGTLEDLRSIRDFEYELDTPEYPDTDMPTGFYQAKYYMDTENNLIHSLFLECSLDLNTTRKISVLAVCLDANKEETQLVNHKKIRLTQKIKNLF